LTNFFYNCITFTTGMTPFFANSGRHPIFDTSIVRLPSTVPAAEEYVKIMDTVNQDLRANLAHAQDCYTIQANKSRLPSPQLKVGDSVFLNRKNIKTARRSLKLDHRNLGPFKISRMISPIVFELHLPATMKIHPVFHVSLLEPKTKDIVKDFVQPPPPPVIIADDDIQYEVEEILDAGFVSKGPKKVFHYLVRWKGYAPAHDSWEPVENVENAPELVADFHLRYPDKPVPPTTSDPGAGSKSRSKPAAKSRAKSGRNSGSQPAALH
jgi:hypothetical protein